MLGQLDDALAALEKVLELNDTIADIYEPGLGDIVSASQMDEDMGIREQAEQLLRELRASGIR